MNLILIDPLLLVATPLPPVKAVERKYLYSAGSKEEAHSMLADWFGGIGEMTDRKVDELPYQLEKVGNAGAK